MSNNDVFEQLDHATLLSVCGGSHSPSADLSAAWTGIQSGARAAGNVANGFAGGATYGANAKESQIAQYGNRGDTGCKPGVETGMMFDQALGPVGKVISTAAGSLPSGGR